MSREVLLRLATRRHDTAAMSEEVAERIDALCHALIAESQESVVRLVLDIQAGEESLDALYMRYLAPAAERLGLMWERDELTFLQVALGVGRIYDLVRLLRDRLPPPRVTRDSVVLFATVPGEHHGIGIEMAAELLRQRGWDIKLLIGGSHDEVMAEIARSSCLILGLSSSGRASGDALARLLGDVRLAHPNIHVIVSGRIVLEDPDLLDRIGPDSTVATIEEAITTFENLAGPSS
ncbi:cobalamin-dependent protein [Lutimaribacter sp. EGI FJ00013]|uniref:Cobalamin-dependent protein n=1 Tax=Lutimaribacter degradans TaxID=2945989 RepID=A0ACC5ZW77_9RHOB|nr:cobalamin-dependent protein [Lutimaribacter sp. EGI FJ00013]